MNKTKNNILLGGAVLSIIYGIVVAIMANEAQSGRLTPSSYNTLLILFGVGTVIIGILICIPQLRRNKTLIVAEIGFLVAIIINTVVFLQNPFARVNSVELLILFAVIGMGVLFAGLVFPDKPGETRVSASSAPPVPISEIPRTIIGSWHFDSNPHHTPAPVYYCYFRVDGSYSYSADYQTPESLEIPGVIGRTYAKANYSITGTTIYFTGVDDSPPTSYYPDPPRQVFGGGQQYATDVYITPNSLTFVPPGVNRRIRFERSD